MGDRTGDARGAAGRAGRTPRGSATLTGASRVGLAGRGVFYLILTYLVVRIGAKSATGQADANGVFRTVTAQPLGAAAIVVAVLGVLAFGAARIAAALGDRRVSFGRRVSAAGQGCTYLVLAAFTTYYLVTAAPTGTTQVGSEQTHQSGAGTVLAEPAGRLLLAALGVVVVGVCLWQIWNALAQNYVAGIADEQMPRALGWLLRFTGTGGSPLAPRLSSRSVCWSSSPRSPGTPVARRDSTRPCTNSPDTGGAWSSSDSWRPVSGCSPFIRSSRPATGRCPTAPEH